MGELEQVLSGERRFVVLHGDCIEKLQLLPDNSVDAVCSDPPYGLTTITEKMVREALECWLAGKEYKRKGRGFMSRNWDSFVPGPEVFREVLRVLKPGGHMACFAGSRTVDLMGIAVRLAGFEIRDTIEHYGYIVTWTYGSGMPKSINVSRVIDEADFKAWCKARPLYKSAVAQARKRYKKDPARVRRLLKRLHARAGLVREVVHSYQAGGNAGTSIEDKGGTYVVGAPNSDAVELTVTRGATEKSQRFDGVGTGIRPSQEPILLCRKPLDGTIVDNALKHGTGGLNIDDCRTAMDWSERDNGWFRSGHSAQPDAPKIAAPPGEGINCHPGGRWPANVTLGHHPSCNCQCVDGCPVEVIGRQGGQTKSSGGLTPGVGRADSPLYSFGDRLGANAGGLGDNGNTARYFPQFRFTELDWPFCYTAKASSAERDAGLDDFPTLTRGQATGRDNDSAGVSHPRAGAGGTGERRCSHPTVKPAELLRWLVRLITPKGGVCLDMFMGSGSTGVACMLEGRRFVGIELNDTETEPYVRIARARIEHVIGRPPEEAKPRFAKHAKQGVLF